MNSLIRAGGGAPCGMHFKCCAQCYNKFTNFSIFSQFHPQKFPMWFEKFPSSMLSCLQAFSNHGRHEFFKTLCQIQGCMQPGILVFYVLRAPKTMGSCPCSPNSAWVPTCPFCLNKLIEVCALFIHVETRKCFYTI